MQDLIKLSYETLFSEEFSYTSHLSYSGQFSDFNANGRFDKMNRTVEIKISKKWRTVSNEIKIGLIQSLLLKLFNDKREKMHQKNLSSITSINIDLYNSFLKNLHLVVPKDKSDPLLEERFHLLNEKYFSGLIERPNLTFGTHSRRKLGSYNYKTDTIMISRVFENKPEHIDLVLFHEMLHKKHKFNETDTGRCMHHTTAFRKEEKSFESFEEREAAMQKFVRNYRIKKWFGFT